MRRVRLPAKLLGLGVGGVALVLVAGVLLGPGGSDATPAPPARSRPGRSTAAPRGVTRDALAGAMATAPAPVAANGNDWVTWAQLGAAYVEEGRITVDPSYYPKAEGALQRSMAIHSQDNFEAHIGLGALANARHEFSAAVDQANQALAVDAYSGSAYGVLVDGLTQLGDYPGATAALQKMLNVRPGIAAFTRASYDFEIHGATSAAQAALERALADASAPPDVAFCRYYLGELAFNAGDLAEATRQYALGLQADATYDPLLEGKAKAEAAGGDTAAAIRDYTTVVNRVPQAQYVIELGDLYGSVGRSAEAQQQYALLEVERRLLAANGVVDDLTPALFAADHGDPAGALRAAQAEWGRRHSVLVADALGWALHANGRDTEALPYARQAGAIGWPSALFLYHQGMIEQALGQGAAARHDLSRALHINPYFSLLQAPLARTALTQLGGAE
ncbi:MAG: tetratricopeptide repeat protein [Actinomycetota bacterium]